MIKAVDEFILSPFNRSGLCAYDMDQYKGFEPSPTEWKSVMLPLHQYWIKEFLEENSYKL